MLLWASSFIALKSAFVVYPPMWVIAGRMVVGLCCFLLLGKRLLNFKYRAGDWRLLFLISICEPCIFFLLESLALTYTSASQAGMMTAMGPVLTALAALIFLQERLSKMRWLGFFIAMSGVVILTIYSEEDVHAPNPLLGNSLEFLAMICAAVYSIGFKMLSVRYSAVSLTACSRWSALAFLFPLHYLLKVMLCLMRRRLVLLFIWVFLSLWVLIYYTTQLSP